MSNYPVEIIPAAAISENLSGATVLIIDTTRNDGVLNALQELYPKSPVKVLYTKAGINQVDVTTSKAERANLKIITLCGEEPPKPQSILPHNRFYTAALISSGSGKTENSILQYILKDKSALDFAHIAYQTYHYDSSILKTLIAKSFEELRLGVLRKDISLSEPLLRSKETVFVDLQSIRFGDLPDNTTLSPNGLYAEEICQIARYIGMAQRLKSVFVYGYPSKSKSITPTSRLLSEIIWHINEALSSNIYENPENAEKDDSFMRKIVSMGDDGQEIVFITSSLTGRWWLEIPEVKANKNHYVACSNTDYLSACSGEIPLRWLYFFQKINPN
jgi:hypothetical protein